MNELTAKRLLTLHNLTFMERLMRGLREAIMAGEYAREAERVLAGEAARARRCTDRGGDRSLLARRPLRRRARRSRTTWRSRRS